MINGLMYELMAPESLEDRRALGERERGYVNVNFLLKNSTFCSSSHGMSVRCRGHIMRDRGVRTGL